MRQAYPETRVRSCPGKKDTRRWCKGIPGREHDYRMFYKAEDRFLSSIWTSDEYKCANCGRQIFRHIKFRADTEF